MELVIERHGGLMARKPKAKAIPVEELDAPTKEALKDFLQNTSEPPVQSRMPDSFVYSFKFDDPEIGKKEVAVQGSHVPEPLRRLLP
jgi:hypothetical protein